MPELLDALLFREYLMQERQALLMRLDNIERYLAIHPRTAELRKEAKERARSGVIELEQKEAVR